MDARQRRLLADMNRLMDLCKRSSKIGIQPINGLYDRYIVTFTCKGLVWLTGRPRPSVTTEHRLEVYLHLDYPRLPPRLQWLTDIFHPNILPPAQNGGVCIGRWTPAETLDQLILRIGEMIQYKNYSTKDALNLHAAAWAEQNAAALPVETTPLIDSAASIIDITLGAR